MNFIRGSAFLCFSLTVTAVNAEITYQEYKNIAGDPGLKGYVAGVGSGLSWANTTLRTDSKSLIYCPPERAEFSADDYFKVIEKKAKHFADLLGNEALQMAPIEYLLVRGMMDSYPCHRGYR